MIRGGPIAKLLLVAAFVAAILGIRLLVTKTVTWPAPEPWEDGVPYLVGGYDAAAETLVTIGGRPIGRVTVEDEPSERFGNHPRRELRKLTVMRVDRSVRLTRDSGFTLRSFDGQPVISVTIGGGDRLEPWDEVPVEVPPAQPLAQ